MAIFPCRGDHILIIPYPAQGHMLPLLDLTHQLCSLLNQTTTITILTTPKNLPTHTPLLRLHPSIQTLTLPFPPHPSIPAGVENAKDLPPGTPPSSMIHALGGLYQPLLSWFHSHPSPPSAILSDFFLGWTHRLADQVGTRRIVFSPSGALAISILYSLWRDMPVPSDDLSAELSFDNIPKSPKYPWWQISSIYRCYSHSGSDPVSEFIKDGFKANLESWGLVINTFDDVEGVYLDYLRKKLLGHDRVWAVGPLILGRAESSGPGLDDDVARFLDASDADSVVYVAFGSQTTLKNDQMAALAAGLEKSRVRFIWSVKVPADGHVDDGYGAVPEEFETRTAGRGIVVRGWAPQAAILSHRAVGAFLTHCGWNSVLESIAAGVPMLTWPMGADQFVDAGLVVDELKVGVRVCEGRTSVPDSDELSRVLSESVSGESASGLRQRASKLKEKAREAVKDGGSSARGLKDIVKRVFEN
uniref:Glycosyltransferase n=1 Tax=Kalanchoe fedtschenkoi TaxID=63787 RepID=A0A7N0R8A2_KALFE